MTVEEIQSEILAGVPGCQVEVALNESPSAQHSLRIDREHALAVAKLLRASPEMRLDYCSNVTGVDWLDAEIAQKATEKKLVDGKEQEVVVTRKRFQPGYLEAVYHLYSMEKKLGPVILRMRTVNRTDQVELPSLTSVWRSAEFQEREIFDLYGIVFTGHPDLRRLLMWEGFLDHPMRKDYVPPPEEDDGQEALSLGEPDQGGESGS